MSKPILIIPPHGSFFHPQGFEIVNSCSLAMRVLAFTETGIVIENEVAKSVDQVLAALPPGTKYRKVLRDSIGRMIGTAEMRTPFPKIKIQSNPRTGRTRTLGRRVAR